MALLGTHMRFAVEMSDRYPVRNMDRYIAGTVYPDSRWVTGVDREMTHADRYLRPDFATDDFTLGWHLHCLYDRRQSMCHKARFRDLPAAGEDGFWVGVSALKVIQDMADIRCFDIKSYLPCLDVAENPNGETRSRVARFNRTLQKTYGVSGYPSLVDYRTLWCDIGLAPETADAVIDRTRQLMADARLKQRIESVHDRIMDRFRNDGQQTDACRS